MSDIVCPRDTKFNAFSFGTKSLDPGLTNLGTTLVFVEIAKKNKEQISKNHDVTNAIEKVITHASSKGLTLSGMKLIYFSPAQKIYFKIHHCRINEDNQIVLAFSGSNANEKLHRIRKDV